MVQAVLGIDVSKRTLQIALLMGDQKPKHKSISNDSKGYQCLLEWLSQKSISKVHACMESTSTYGNAIGIALFEAGHTVSIVNPARVKGFAQSELSRTKTDSVDAALIARFCLALQPSPWTPAPEEIQELQSLMRRLESLNQMLVQERNRLETASGQTAVLIEQHMSYLKTQVKTVKQSVHEHFQVHDSLRQQRDLLTSIPGIGEATAAILIAEIQDWQRFSSAKQFAAYMGLSPSECSSGSSVRGRPHLSRLGSKRLRKAFYLPAIVAKKHNPAIRVFYERLRGRGKNKMQAIGAAMRKLAHIVYGVLKSNQPFDPNYSLKTEKA